MNKTDKVIAQFTQEEKQQIEQSLNRTFTTIASDIMACDGATSLTRAVVIETVLDAGYLEIYCNPSAREALAKFRKLSYDDQILFARTVFTASRYS